ncbi:MAG: hypothetical protein KBA02_00330 [Paludibacteraceae bacterium]|nr:hypothetical protein [Paludibacteraceae bacterium]
MLIVRPNTYVPGTVIRSAEVNNDFDTIYTDYNGNIDDDNIVAGANIAWTKIDKTGAVVDDLSGAVPIGSMIWFYDFNGLLTFDTNSWKYCNGQVTAVGGIGAQTLPDASNRYIVGFGTEAGTDIGTAPWAVAPVGEASHLINIEHSHGVGTFAGPSHTHTGPSHTHTAGTYYAPDHYHGRGTLAVSDATHTHTLDMKTGYSDTVGVDYVCPGANTTYTSATSTVNGGTHNHSLTGSIGNTGAGHSGDVNLPLGGTSAAAGTGATGASGTGAITGTSANSLSTTQTIQPRSIRARLIMRVA